MPYGRARLWLGITGVGSLVTIATLALSLQLPSRLLAETELSLGPQAFLSLVLVTLFFALWLVPFDFLGGYLLPRLYRKSEQEFSTWAIRYLKASMVQAAIFVLFGVLIVLASQSFGRFAGGLTVGLCMIACFEVRNRLLYVRKPLSETSTKKLVGAIAMVHNWQIFAPRVIVVDHQDKGFTGGIIGFGRKASIVIPHAWLSFSRSQLAAAIARRAVAVSSGSYTRGLLLAFGWNLVGFLGCSYLPGAALDSVPGLLTTLCGFTLWSFLGLLTLPTLSRNSSLRIDEILKERGMTSALISSTASAMDHLQDDEPERPVAVETIFHPIPSVAARTRTEPVRGWDAWNVARTTLFFSWGCLGFLSRSVHCNVGRPELWMMLPTD